MQEIINTDSLKAETQEIVSKVIEETDPKKIKDLTDLFNLSMSKKNIVRLTKLNDLLDHTTDQALERFEKQPDQFSNKDLLDYMNTVSNISDRALNSLRNAESFTPIQLNQQNNNVNITVGGADLGNLSRDSRARILDAVNSILNQTVEVEGEVVDSEPSVTEVDIQSEDSI